MKPPRATGYVSPGLALYAPRPTVCIVPECGRAVAQGDYCAGHYQRVRRTGEPGPAQLRAYRRKVAGSNVSATKDEPR